MFQSLARTCSVVTSFLNFGGVKSGKQLIESLNMKNNNIVRNSTHSNGAYCYMEFPYSIITVSVRQASKVAVFGAIMCDKCLGKVKLYRHELII